MSKKSFKNNPALQFVSSRIDASDEKSTENVPPPDWRVANSAPETRSKRFNMLIRPSVFSLLQKNAKEKNMSVNELINSLIEIYIENRYQKM